MTTIVARNRARLRLRIEELTGLKGKLDEKEGVFKVSAPRSDLSVSVAGTHDTADGMTSWAAFVHAGKHTMAMGIQCCSKIR